MPLAQRHERVLGIAALILLAIGCALVLWPFLTALLWAAVLCSSTWPIYRAFERMLGGHRGLAAALMTLSVALFLVAPFAILIVTLAESVRGLIATLGRLVEQGPPGPPTWVGDIPVIGDSGRP